MFRRRAESGRANQRVPDEEVLQLATESGRAVLTLNRVDFHTLHRPGKIVRTGIVTCTDNRGFHVLADRIHNELERAGSLEGQLVQVVRG
jgi:hypothetical protein